MSNTQNEAVYTSRHQVVLKVLIHFFYYSMLSFKSRKAHTTLKLVFKKVYCHRRETKYGEDRCYRFFFFFLLHVFLVFHNDYLLRPGKKLKSPRPDTTDWETGRDSARQRAERSPAAKDADRTELQRGLKLLMAAISQRRGKPHCENPADTGFTLVKWVIPN